MNRHTEGERAHVRDRVKKLHREGWTRLLIARHVHTGQDQVRAILGGEWDSYRHSPAEDKAWRLRGACRQGDPEAWFPTTTGPSSRGAKAACAACPVRERCLEWALEHREQFGVWGGLTVRERQAVLRQRKAVAA